MGGGGARYSTYHQGTKLLPDGFRPQLFESPAATCVFPAEAPDSPCSAHTPGPRNPGAQTGWLCCAMKVAVGLQTARDHANVSLIVFRALCGFLSLPATYTFMSFLLCFLSPPLEGRARGISAGLPVFSHQMNSCAPHGL